MFFQIRLTLQCKYLLHEITEGLEHKRDIFFPAVGGCANSPITEVQSTIDYNCSDNKCIPLSFLEDKGDYLQVQFQEELEDFSSIKNQVPLLLLLSMLCKIVCVTISF